MKRTSPRWSFFIPQTALAFLIASNFFLTSCIYERPRGDNFYRTLWESDDSYSDITDDGTSGISDSDVSETSGNSTSDISDKGTSEKTSDATIDSTVDEVVNGAAEGTAEKTSEGSVIGSVDDNTGSISAITADRKILPDLTIEFLCGGNISAKADGAVGSFGTYEADGMTATFLDLTLQFKGATIILEEGYKDKDTMTVRWHYEGSLESHTTIMHRLSEYR